MTPNAIWRKTLIFSWINLGLGLLTLFVCLIIGGGAYFVITNFEFEILTKVAIGCGAFLCVIAIYFIVMSRFGYGIRLGQLAIVERAQRGESIPNNPVEFSKSIVSERFGNSRRYYALSRDISTSLKQILRVLSRGFSLDNEAPELGSSRWLTLVVAHPAIRCVDECCLTYALRKRDYEVNAASIDALTILVQNWRSFIRRAMKLSIIIYVICLLLMALFFIPGFAICRQMVWSSLPWLCVSFFLVLTVKIAFIDSYTLTKIVCEFLNMAEKTDINPENYKKLDSWSKMYAKIRKSAEKAAEKAEDEAAKQERAERKAAKSANQSNVNINDTTSNNAEDDTSAAAEDGKTADVASDDAAAATDSPDILDAVADVAETAGDVVETASEAVVDAVSSITDI